MITIRWKHPVLCGASVLSGETDEGREKAMTTDDEGGRGVTEDRDRGMAPLWLGKKDGNLTNSRVNNPTLLMKC